MKITHVVQDTREKRGKHRNIEEYLRQSGVKIIGIGCTSATTRCRPTGA